MDAQAFDKSRLPGRRATKGPARAQHRAHYCVMGLEPNLEKVKLNKNQRVVCPVSQPISPLGCVVGLQGSLAPDGAIVKVAGMTKLQFRGPARVVDCEGDRFRAVENYAYEEGDVLVIRCEGPEGGPGNAGASIDFVAQSQSKRRIAQMHQSGRFGPQGRGYSCRRKGGSYLLCGHLAG